MPILTKSGRVAIAKALSEQPLHIAWGIGDGAWTTTVPSESANATALISEVGRRVVTTVQFVTPAAAGTGSIVLPTGEFNVSGTPTNNLYLSTHFDFADAPASVIREAGVFVETELIAGLPGGQQYFVPAEVANPGRLLHLENFQPIYRSPAIRELFEIVITF